MTHDFYIDRHYIRSDSMTGAENLLAFFEWLLNHTAEEPFTPFTLLSVDVINLKELNSKHGFAAGDAALRWVTLVLKEEADAKVYRISGDEFVGVLTEGARDNHATFCEKVRTRLVNEAVQVKLDPPAARIAMVHFSSLDKTSPEDILGLIYGALLDVKSSAENTFKIYDEVTTQKTISKTGLINDLIRRMVSLGSMLDKSQKLIHTDSISGLPNMLAAEDKCESYIHHCQANKERFAVLLIDGDDLRKYNKISYLAGDEMIAHLGSLIREGLRPSDFLARWRTGDEFLVLLENTSIDKAVQLGQRLLVTVASGSQDWIYPVTISIGAAAFPDHGETMKELIHQAELGLGIAKDQGKNQVCVSQ